jgi:membrane associated rhomboid family serine protease
MTVLSRNVKVALTGVACLWVIFFLGIILSQFWSVDIRSFGIQPREAEGLAGILFWPFLHGNIFHLLANSFALFFLLLLSLVFFKKLTILALVIITLVGGGAVWVFAGRDTLHIGASGLIFGLIGFMISGGIFRKKLKALLLSGVVLFLYGGLLLTLLVRIPGISWHGHLFGFLAGVLAAWLTRAMGKGKATASTARG